MTPLPAAATRFPLLDSASAGSTAAAPAGAAIRRILILKLDHIGDVLIAAPALMLLRKSFAGAHITVICGPWNEGLIRRLGVADEIHTSRIFSQSSLADLDAEAMAARRLEAVEALQALDLAPFDLAIDLRRDEDTRELLKLFDAGLYAGFGDLETYGYLDVALPFAQEPVNDGATTLRLGPGDLDGGMGNRRGAHGLHLTAASGEVDLSVSTDALWPPSDDGIPDVRLLGAALWGIDVRRGLADSTELAAPRPLTRDEMRFGPGWIGWEPWGRWSSAETSWLTVNFPTTSPHAELLVRVQGHVSDSHPRARVTVSAGEASGSRDFQVGAEPETIRLACKVRVAPPVARAEPVLLRGGRYRGMLRLHVDSPAEWEPLSLVVRGSRLRQVLARIETPAAIDRAGPLDFPFELHLKDAAEAIAIEIRSDPERRTGHVAIVGVELDCLQARPLRLPIAHMEAQLLDLAAMVALRFAPRLIAPEDEIAGALAAPREGSSAVAAVGRLRRRREKRGFFARFQPDRRIIGIGIGANKQTKLWPMANFADLCRRLLARPEIDLAFIGGPAEAEPIAGLIADLGGGERLIDLCSASRIEDLGEILAEIDGFIGLDTGTTHFAGRVGLPTLALFGAAHDPREWGPVGARSGWAALDVPCAGCFRAELNQCDVGLQCMTMLRPEDVWPLVERQLLQT